jgi:hypothetical protein
MAWLRAQGFTVEKVEHRLLPFGSRNYSTTTKDFCGFADILAFCPGEVGVLAVQATSADHVPDRVKKIQAEPRAAVWLAAANRIQVVGWALRSGESHRKTWRPTVVNVLPPAGAITVESPQ